MKLLMTTSADANLRGYTPYTLPIQKMWAKKWGADYRILNDPAYSRRAMWCYRTLIFYDLFETYDRILYIDADIIINKNCPNVFEIVPYDTVGAVLEDKGSRRKERLNRIRRVKAHLGEIDWQDGFFNMGFYIVSRVHRDMFQRVNGKLWENKGWDSPFYSYQITRFGYKYVDLGYKWNHMSMFSEDWNGNPSRFDSHIIHYAGSASFPDKDGRSREQLMKDDAKVIYGETRDINDSVFNKLFIDVGVGRPNTEAWGREKDFTIIGLEPGLGRYNKIKDVYPGKLLNVAVSDKNGEIDYWESPEHGVVLFMGGDNLNKDFKKVRKKTIKLDNLEWRGFDEIHIWADIEGSELLMLKGATEMLSSGKVKWINLEIRKNTPVEGWATAKQIYGFLDKYGFKPEVLITQLRERRHKDVIFTPKEEK